MMKYLVMTLAGMIALTLLLPAQAAETTPVMEAVPAVEAGSSTEACGSEPALPQAPLVEAGFGFEYACVSPVVCTSNGITCPSPLKCGVPRNPGGCCFADQPQCVYSCNTRCTSIC